MNFIGGRTVRDLWAERRAVSGDDRFLVYEAADGAKDTYSYVEFDELLNVTARAFHDEFGVEFGDHVAIHLPNSPAYLQIWFALAKLGAVTVHSNANHTARELSYTLENSDTRLVVTRAEFEKPVEDAVDGVSAVEETIYVSDGPGDAPTLAGLVDGASAELPPADLTADDPVQIIYTSGTTSDPKGVVHSHANLVYCGERRSKHVALQRGDRTMTALPVFHANAQGSVLETITTGNSLVLLEEFSASSYVDQLRRHQVTHTSLVGTQVRALLATPERATDADNDLRVISYAINVSDEEKEAFERRFDAPLVNGYGLTEALVTVTKAPLHGDRSWPAVGRPTFDREIHLLSDGSEVNVGEVGEIAVAGTRGQNLMMGYYELPELTEAAFTEEGWLLTGDYGRFDKDGNLYFVDRKKHMIKTRGENVSELGVQSVLQDHPDVDAVAVIGVPDDFYGEAIKAFVKPTTDDLSAADVIAFAEEQLADFKIPSVVEFVDEFPRTSIGKIEKSVLRKEKGEDK